MSAPEQQGSSFNPKDHSFHLIRKPDLSDIRFGREELATIGEIPIVTNNWGRYLTADQIKEDFARRGLLSADDVATIDGSGFSGGWHLDPEVDPVSDEMQEDSAQRAAALVERLAKIRGWNGVDHLAVASVTLKRAMVGRIQEILEQRGLAVNKTQFYHIACAGGTTIIGDSAASEDLQGKRVIGIGQEVLSGSIVDPNDVTMNHVFGVGQAGLAFKPGEDIIHHYGERLVKKDTGGIKIPRFNELPPPERRQPLPPMYKIADEESQQVFAIDSDGSVILLMPTEPGSKHGIWTPSKAAKFFFAEGPKFFVPALMRLKQTGFDLGRLGVAIMHQATKKTNEGLMRFIANQLAKLKSSEGIDIPMLKDEFLLGEAKVNNMSGPTSLFQALEMAKRNLIPKGEPIPLGGYAIGAFFGFDVVEFV